MRLDEWPDERLVEMRDEAALAEAGPLRHWTAAVEVPPQAMRIDRSLMAS
jgi:hypothetical protein